LVVHIIVRHPSSSSRIVRHRAPVITGDGQRQSAVAVDQLRQVVSKCVRQHPPWRSFIIRHRRSSAPRPPSSALPQSRGRHHRRSQAA
jgi:hypothetical protein